MNEDENKGRIAIFIMGGQISHYKEKKSNGIFPIEKKEDILPFIKELASDTIKIFNLPVRSAFKILEDWEVLYNSIKKRIHAFDGFIVLHEADTIIFGSSLLSYMLRGVKKPILFITSPEHITHQKLNSGVINIRNAILSVKKDIGETAILSKESIIRAVRARRHNSISQQPFYSGAIDDLGEIREEKVNLSLHRINRADKIEFKYTFPQKTIVLVRIFPGISPSVFYNLAKDEEIKGVFIESLGDGALQNELLESILFVQESGIRVTLLAEHDSINRDIHHDRDKITYLSLCILKNIPIWPAFAKMHVALENTSSSHEFKRFMQSPINGDLLE